MKTYTSKGIICLKGQFQLTYAVCEVTYTLNSDDSFQFVFKPNYPVIELLNSSLFQGIPGLNLDLRKKEYIRTTTPTFFSERIPSTKREDYNELLEKAHLEFMDPIKYLIQTKEQYSGDKLFMREFEEKKLISFNDYHGHQTNSALIKQILDHICFGNDISINGQIINDDNRKSFHDVFINLYERSYLNHKEKQRNGIEKAKQNGCFKGRKPVAVDHMLFEDLLEAVNRGEIKPKEAAKKLGISIDKYYRVRKELQK